MDRFRGVLGWFPDGLGVVLGGVRTLFHNKSYYILRILPENFSNGTSMYRMRIVPKTRFFLNLKIFSGFLGGAHSEKSL